MSYLEEIETIEKKAIDLEKRYGVPCYLLEETLNLAKNMRQDLAGMAESLLLETSKNSDWISCNKKTPEKYPVLLGRHFLNKMEKEVEGSNFIISHLISDEKEFDIIKKERAYTHWIDIPFLPITEIL